MKEKMMFFVVGLLVGAVISTGAFLVYTKVMTCNNNQIRMPGGNLPGKTNGQNNQPPERPNEENGQSSQNGQSTQNDNNTQNNN